MKRRHAILLLGGASSGAMSVGTGAFSSVEADRGVEVNVVDDDEAYLGLKDLTANEEEDDEIVKSGTETELARITNKFANRLSLTITLEDRGEVIERIAIGDSLETGDEKRIDLIPGEKAFVAVTCETEKTTSTSVTLSFVGDTDGATVNKTRTFEFRCTAAEEDDGRTQVIFLDNGKVKIETESGDGINARAYIRGPGKSGKGSIESTESDERPTGEELGPKDFGWGNNGVEIVGIGVNGAGVFTHDQAGKDRVTSEIAASSAEEAFGDDFVGSD